MFKHVYSVNAVYVSGCDLTNITVYKKPSLVQLRPIIFIDLDRVQQQTITTDHYNRPWLHLSLSDTIITCTNIT